MPQMAPMNWLTLFFLFSIILIIFNIINFFNKSNSHSSTLKSQSPQNKIFWKW